MSKKSIKVYDFSLTAGGSTVIYGMGEYFRIQSATGALDVTVEGMGTISGMLTGQAVRDTPYTRILIKDVSGAANSGLILCSGSEFMDNRTYGVNSLDAATIASLKNGVVLDAATIASLKLSTPRPEVQNAFFSDMTALAANTAVTIFTPAANVNGAILLTAAISFYDVSVTGIHYLQSFIANSVAPVSTVNGPILLQSNVTFITSNAAAFGGGAQLSKEQFIKAGDGLYFISSNATTADNFNSRSCRYKLL